MGEEKIFLEGNKDTGIGPTVAAPAVQPAEPDPVPSKLSSGVSSDAAVAASSVQAASPPDAQKNPLEQKVIDEALKKCFDPEIPVNIWELGLIYDVNVSPEGLANVKMTLTAPACPVAGSLPGEVETKIKAIPGVTDAKVELVWEPPWNPEMMSRVAKVMLGM
jgi:FeS assembly SUF system protein